MSNPTLATVVSLLAQYSQTVFADSLRIQVEEKDVIEEQSFIDDANLRVIEADLREGGEIHRSRCLLLIEEIKRLRLELADFEMMCDHTSQIYGWATRGQISKPQTDPIHVIGLAEDYLNRDVEEALQERTRMLWRNRERQKPVPPQQLRLRGETDRV